MRLVEIDEQTEDTFYRCLHDELPLDPQVAEMRKAWRAAYQPKGHRAKVLFDDQERVVGLTNYIPIEHSPYEGENLMAILCMWIHGYEHLVGNQQSKGYGRFMLSEIEQDARASGCLGVAVWGKDYAAWNPVSFYIHMGYEEADRIDQDVLVWKRFSENAAAPALVRSKPELYVDPSSNKSVLTSVRSGWCGGACQQCVAARKAAAEVSELVVFKEVYAHERDDIRARGASIDGLFLDGEALGPDDPPLSKDALVAVLKQRLGK